MALLIDRYIKKKDETIDLEGAKPLLIDRYVAPKAEVPKIEPIQKPGIFKRAAIGAGKFLARTGVEALNLLSSTLDFTADLLSSSISEKLKQPSIGLTLGETQEGRERAKKWEDFYSKTGGVATEKIKSLTQDLRKVEFISPSEEWVRASTQEKLTTKLPETILNIGPGVVSSIGAFAINPMLGFALSSGSVADDVSEIAKESGVDKKKAELLGLGTGIVVGFLDRIVPDEIFSPNAKKKFVGTLAKRMVKTGLKEMGTEVVQEDVQILVESTLRDDLGLDEIVVRNTMAGLGGLFGGIGASGAVSFVNNVRGGEIGDIKPEDVKTPPEIEVKKREAVKLEPKPEGVKSAIVTIRPDKTAGMFVEVEEGERGKGIGAEAVKALETEAIKKDVSQMRISVFEESQGFFEKQGYSIFEGAKVEKGMIAMEKALEPITEAPKKEKVTKIPKEIEPLAKEARKYKSAEEFVSKNKVYHGTKHTFDVFEKRKRGQVTKAPTASEGIFFTNKKEIAEGYANLGDMPKVDAQQELVNRLEKQAHITGNWSVYDKAVQKLEEFAYSEENKVFKGDVREAYLDMKKPFVVDMKGRAFNEGESYKIIQQAKKQGYDGVIYKNVADAVETEKGTGARPESEWSDVSVVFSEKQIKPISYLISVYTQATKGVVVKPKKEVKIAREIIQLQEKVIEKKIETTKDVKGVRETIRSISQDLNTAVTEAEGRAIVSQEQRAGLNVEDINQLKRIYALNKKFQEGDIETIRESKSGPLLNRVLENIQEKHPNFREEEAFDFALSLPTKVDEKARTSEIIQLEKKEKKLRNYLDQLRDKQKELKIEESALLTKEWESVLAAQERLTQLIRVPEAQLPVGEGVERVSRLEARVKNALGKVTPEEQELLGLSTFRQMNRDNQIAKASKYVSENTDEALRVLRGEIDPPTGILKNSVYVALKELGSADTQIATQIASLASTRFGQEINILKEIDKDSPVSLMEDVVKARIEGYKRKGKDLKQAIKRESDKIKIEKPSKGAWDSFLASIRC